MTRIEELEQLLNKWKAVFKKTSRSKVQAYNYAEGSVDGLETAIGIIKDPSNTQMHVDTKARCDKCKNWNDKSIMVNFCYNCGRPLSQ